jgi:hypothetical protein
VCKRNLPQFSFWLAINVASSELDVSDGETLFGSDMTRLAATNEPKGRVKNGKTDLNLACLRPDA